MSTERLLRLRKSMNRKRPRFLHQEHWKLKRFKKASWRKPRGKRSKMRTKEKAKPALVSIGYRGPRKVRGWHPRGSPEILVRNVQDVQQVVEQLQQPSRKGKKSSAQKSQKKKEIPVVRIASSVGNRKKIDIMRIAQENSLYVANPRIDQVILTTVEDITSYLPLKKYITAWRISGKLLEEDREDIEEEARDKGIEVME